MNVKFALSRCFYNYNWGESDERSSHKLDLSGVPQEQSFMSPIHRVFSNSDVTLSRTSVAVLRSPPDFLFFFFLLRALAFVLCYWLTVTTGAICSSCYM